ncbi:peptide ABC transporter substrate-binding protein [Litorilinea aerophila]|uniref:peptide ABC transporter substrate-binding protein n=1 Tax=Litorilinea aerophila TaxID=1204385 RepID=UPI0014774941|nr:peptide ABC transporter substrate-binding protein [Litorilinea aerophila]MCC9077545.1 peptide ABC transporter substrate-binding protein [Litorilinea aerophila]
MNKVNIRLLVAAAATLLLLVLAGCSAPAQQAAPAEQGEQAAPASAEGSAPAAQTASGEKVLILGLYQEPELLNPLIRTQTAANLVAGFVEEGLVDVDPDGEYYPVLAKEVPSVENGLVSEDGLTVRYNLLEDVVWSDGEPFTCDDVLFTWEVAVNPDSGAVNTTGFDKIASITCEDDHTAVVQFSEFYAPFKDIFTFVLPRHATGDPAQMQEWEFNWNPIGTGPFKLESWTSGDSLVFVANENYRGQPDKPHLDKLIVRIIPSREVGKALITSGEIHFLWDLTEADVPEFRDNPDITVNSAPGPGTERLVLNLADPTLDATDDPLNNPHPLLGDLRVRQAIQYGIDKQFIVDELLYGATTVGVSELSLGWAKCDIPPSEYNPDKARALLEEAGFIDQDGDGIRECHGCLYAEEGTPLRLKYQTTSGNQLREESQQLILEMMADIGIEFYIENVPSSELFGSWASGAFRKHGQFDVLMYTTSDSIDPHSQMDGYFHKDKMPTEANGGNGFNYSRWVNDIASEAIDRAGASPDPAVRKENYQIACEQIAAELPHIYLYDRAEIHLTRSNVKGYQVNVWSPHDQSWNAADWDIE